MRAHAGGVRVHSSHKQPTSFLHLFQSSDMESKMLPALYAQYEGDKERNAQMRSKFNKGVFAGNMHMPLPPPLNLPREQLA